MRVHSSSVTSSETVKLRRPACGLYVRITGRVYRVCSTFFQRTATIALKTRIRPHETSAWSQTCWPHSPQNQFGGSSPASNRRVWSPHPRTQTGFVASRRRRELWHGTPIGTGDGLTRVRWPDLQGLEPPRLRRSLPGQSPADSAAISTCWRNLFVFRCMLQ